VFIHQTKGRAIWGADIGIYCPQAVFVGNKHMGKTGLAPDIAAGFGFQIGQQNWISCRASRQFT
jgi:hypothetical protein